MIYRPYIYQTRAMQWILDTPFCALFLDCGLGKSVITLTAISRLIDDAEVSRVLVVAPKKVAESTWTAEASKWEHTKHLRVEKVLGTAAQRNAALDRDADIYVTGRDNIVWLVQKYKGILPFDMLVLDELTSFKSPKSQRFKAVRVSRPSVARVVGLTGTPAPNGMIDLWAQMYCIDGGQRLGRSVTRYRQTYFNEYRWNNIVVKSEIKKGCEKAIQDKIADVCLTMQAKDYLQLPRMMELTESVPLSAKIRDEYNRFERDKVLEFVKEHEADMTDPVLATNAAALMSKLSQFTGGAVYDSDGLPHEVHGEKIARLAELVEAAVSSGSGVLVFYQFKHEISRIEQALKGFRVRRYEGNRELQDWNAGQIDVLLAHPASTAFGLNMQAGGHYIVWFGTGWNLELYQQANARLHRQGQQHPVTVYRLVCPGTVDERAVAALGNKKSVQQGLMDGLKDLIKKHINS